MSPMNATRNLMPSISTYRWLLTVCRRSIWIIVVLCALQAGMAVIGVSYALLMRDAIDAAVGRDVARFWLMAAVFATVLAMQIALRAITIYMSELCRSSIDNQLRLTVFGGILESDAAYANRYHSGELMNRLTSDITVVSEAIVTLAPTTVAMVIRVVGVVTVMFLLSPTLTTIFLAAGLAMTGVSIALRQWLKLLHKQVQEAEGRVRSFMQECLDGLMVIQAFGVSAKMLRRARSVMSDHQHARLRRAAANNIASTGLNTAMQSGYVIGFLWCGYGLLHGTISYGTLMAVIQLIGQIQMPFAALGGMFPQYAAMIASVERLIDVMPADAEHAGNGTAAAYSTVPSSSDDNAHREREVADMAEHTTALRFSHVSFAYGSTTVLDDFSCIIHPGEFTAITGRSGAGKSTLMKLLLGAYTPQAGTVGLDMTDTDGDRHIVPPGCIPTGFFAYVPQGNGLMSGSIRQVVAFPDRRTDPEAIDDARVHWACVIADAAEFVEALPDQYDTVLGEHGSGLSEGQMQRLAVARALYSQAPILLLDESTSALDTRTEHAMLSRIRALHNRTVIIITHRAEVLGFCDRVIHVNAEHTSEEHNN